MKGILGRKVGMTECFTKDGNLIPVTVIHVEPNVVTQVKTKETDGYNAIQLAVTELKEKRATKAHLGHAKKANTTPKRFLKEIRNYEGTLSLGDIISADAFSIGEIVDVTGTSKGKGFQGVIKRHNQSRGPMTHGSHFHRRPGSMGTMLPKRVLKGKNLPGHMGHEVVTVQNLEVIDINLEDNYILVSGNVPGPKKSLVLIKSAVKNNKKVSPKELITYEEEVSEEIVEETVVDEVIEDTVTEEIIESNVEVAIEEATTENADEQKVGEE